MSTRRLKHYAAQSGYVYDYYFVGQREPVTSASDGAVGEYIFDVTPDRKTTYAVSVFLCADALEAWAARHGRTLSAQEQYAAAKMCLLAALDEVADIASHPRRFLLNAENIESLLEPLGLD